MIKNIIFLGIELKMSNKTLIEELLSSGQSVEQIVQMVRAVGADRSRAKSRRTVTSSQEGSLSLHTASLHTASLHGLVCLAAPILGRVGHFEPKVVEKRKPAEGSGRWYQVEKEKPDLVTLEDDFGGGDIRLGRVSGAKQQHVMKLIPSKESPRLEFELGVAALRLAGEGVLTKDLRLKIHEAALVAERMALALESVSVSQLAFNGSECAGYFCRLASKDLPVSYLKAAQDKGLSATFSREEWRNLFKWFPKLLVGNEKVTTGRGSETVWLKDLYASGKGKEGQTTDDLRANRSGVIRTWQSLLSDSKTRQAIEGPLLTEASQRLADRKVSFVSKPVVWLYEAYKQLNTFFGTRPSDKLKTVASSLRSHFILTSILALCTRNKTREVNSRSKVSETDPWLYVHSACFKSNGRVSSQLRELAKQSSEEAFLGRLSVGMMTVILKTLRLASTQEPAMKTKDGKSEYEVPPAELRWWLANFRLRMLTCLGRKGIEWLQKSPLSRDFKDEIDAIASAGDVASMDYEWLRYMSLATQYKAAVEKSLRGTMSKEALNTYMRKNMCSTDPKIPIGGQLAPMSRVASWKKGDSPTRIRFDLREARLTPTNAESPAVADAAVKSDPEQPAADEEAESEEVAEEQAPEEAGQRA